MTQTVAVPDTVYDLATDRAEDRDMTVKEAIREIFQEAGYDV